MFIYKSGGTEMKTVKVTLPSLICVKETGQLCKIIETGLDFNVLDLPQTLDTIISINGAKFLINHTDLEEGKETTRVFHAPELGDGRICKTLNRYMICDPAIHPCTDCIYHYLATL